MRLPTLYKRSKTGAALQWSIETVGNTYLATHGQVGGKLITDSATVVEGKNGGKKNETSPEDQARLEAQRIHRDKIKYGGYVEDVTKIDENSGKKQYFEPTLAVEMKPATAKHLNEEVYISPKLDGLRCVITKDGAFTRNGKRYVSTKFIEEDLKAFFARNPSVVLDGELYNHSLKDDFNKITSLARKTKAESIKEKDWEAIRDILQLHLFDCYIGDLPSATFEDRQKFLAHEASPLVSFYVVPVPQRVIVNDNSEISRIHDEFVADGYEGAMVRNGDEPYRNGRVKTLQKVKLFKTAEFEIVDFTAGKGKMSEIAARVVVRMANGETSDAGLNYSHSECKEFLENKDKYIGKLATIKFFNLTPDGKLRFGKMIDINRHDL